MLQRGSMSADFSICSPALRACVPAFLRSCGAWLGVSVLVLFVRRSPTTHHVASCSILGRIADACRVCFGCFLLHADARLRRLINGFTTLSAADEVCGALAAVGDCLSLFGWVLAAEAAQVIYRIAADYTGVDLEPLRTGFLKFLRETLMTAIEQHRQLELCLCILIALAWLWLRAGVGSYIRDKLEWCSRAVVEEAHDVRLGIEQRKFTQHCGGCTLFALCH